MPWSILVNPIVLIVVTAAGYAACRGAGFNPHANELLLASGICLFASEAALVPAILNRSHIAALIQSIFLGTIIHLGFILLPGIAIVFATKLGTAFVYWLLAMYWVTLLTTSAVFIRMVRAKSRELMATK